MENFKEDDDTHFYDGNFCLCGHFHSHHLVEQSVRYRWSQAKFRAGERGKSLSARKQASWQSKCDDGAHCAWYDAMEHMCAFSASFKTGAWIIWPYKSTDSMCEHPYGSNQHHDIDNFRHWACQRPYAWRIMFPASKDIDTGAYQVLRTHQSSWACNLSLSKAARTRENFMLTVPRRIHSDVIKYHLGLLHHLKIAFNAMKEMPWHPDKQTLPETAHVSVQGKIVFPLRDLHAITTMTDEEIQGQPNEEIPPEQTDDEIVAEMREDIKANITSHGKHLSHFGKPQERQLYGRNKTHTGLTWSFRSTDGHEVLAGKTTTVRQPWRSTFHVMVSSP